MAMACGGDEGRRGFLKTAAWAGVGAWASGSLAGQTAEGGPLPLLGRAPHQVVFPVPNPAFLSGLPIDRYIMPTASGRVESGLWGCTRNEGRRFHEGVDFGPVQRDRQGVALDPVQALWGGIVRYTNATAGHSSYGMYVVIEHPELQPAVYTLYAHLRRLGTGIAPGARVAAGQVVGIMGNTAGGYRIPLDRSHLHLEIGLRLTDSAATFGRFYEAQPGDEPNRHGLFHGANLVGFDPLLFLTRARDGHYRGMADFIGQLPTDVTLRVAARHVPNFVARYPALLARPVPGSGLLGWDVDFTWFGLPKRWTPLNDTTDSLLRTPGAVTVLAARDEALAANRCRSALRGADTLGDDLRDNVALLFDFR